jgi:hypothetical protein
VDVGLHRLLRPGCCAAHHGHRGVARRMRWPDSSDLLVIKIKIDWVMLSNHRSISIHIYIYIPILEIIYPISSHITADLWENAGKSYGDPIRPTWNPKKMADLKDIFLWVSEWFPIGHWHFSDVPC